MKNVTILLTRYCKVRVVAIIAYLASSKPFSKLQNNEETIAWGQSYHTPTSHTPTSDNNGVLKHSWIHPTLSAQYSCLIQIY